MKKLLNRTLLITVVAILLALAIWGPEQLAKHQDKATLNQIIAEPVEGEDAGYRYSLNSNEKLYILSMCLNNQMLPESEQSRISNSGYDNVGYEELPGTYAFVINRQGPTDTEIKEAEIYDVCNREIKRLEELGVLPSKVRQVTEEAYSAVLYSAIDVLDPRNNMSVWKVSLSTSQQNADKTNRLLDAYVDAETGKLYEFYVRSESKWNDLEPEKILEEWSDYLELQGMEKDDTDNPLLETTPYFEKYRFPSGETGSTVVTIGFYEGINELFLKITE